MLVVLRQQLWKAQQYYRARSILSFQNELGLCDNDRMAATRVCKADELGIDGRQLRAPHFSAQSARVQQ